MENKSFEINAAIQVLKPVNEVFEAIVDPAGMTNYFISQSSGRMEEGKTLTWRFPEFEEDVPVTVGKIENDKYISYYWDNGKNEMLVEMELSAYKGISTIVKVTEKAMPGSEGDINWLKGNTEGWANFLACLKAWMEYGVHLRKGAFDFRFDTEKQ